MPVSAKTRTSNGKLKTPQARVLGALMPTDPSKHFVNWPLLTRVGLCKKLGYSPIACNITRAMNGIPVGSSSGAPHLGLLALGYVKEVPLNIEGVEEVNYRITANGIRAFQAYIAAGGKLPPVKPAAQCTNHKYLFTNQGS